ncbi:translocation and assembly module TamB [Desulfomicrobium norvegicum]|uniref:Translocation and assembly module TamB n=1 Tax=Desulfomicrobium norvegicum (strain DSM 1741 / NCIMB 8310) TaxID=52561 RepID=A0A8G2FEJ5_DESNO|nr:translocation/assembly module TamB domain-containing protein [Desulfomicrobium norvegicum]SFL78302.1 translocation and assembly module TamB [Desulfomicrobium norvegicum]
MNHATIKRLRKTFTILAVCVLLGIACAGLILGTDKGRQGLLDSISSLAAAPDFGLKMEGLRLGDTWTLDRVTVSDARGPWLDAEKLGVRPLLGELLRGRISLEHVGIMRLEITRLPESEETADTSAPPGLPPLRIGAVDIEHIRLGPDVAGREALLSLHGALSLDQDEPHARVRVARLDRAQDAAELDARLHLREQTLNLRLKLHEEPQGLLHSALGMNGTQGIILQAAGSGPLKEWSLNFESMISDVAQLSGNASVNLDADADVDLRALITPGPAWNPFTGLPQESLTLMARGTWRSPVLNIVRIDLQSALGNLDGNATWNVESGILESGANAQGVALSWLMPDDIQAGPVNASATLRLDPQGMRAQGKILLRDMDLAGHAVPAVTAHLSLDLPAGTKDWQVQTQLDALTPTLPEGLRAWTASATLGGEGTGFYAKELRLESDRLGLTGNGTLDSLVSMNTRLDLRQVPTGLGPLSAILDTKLEGRLDLAASSMNASFEATAMQLDGLPEELEMLLGPNSRLLAKLSLSPQLLDVHEARLQARTTAEASGQYDLEKNTFQTRLGAAFPEISFPALRIAQGTTLRASASGSPESFGLDLVAGSARISSGERTLSDVTAAATVRGLPAKPMATLDANAMAGQDPVSLELRIAPDKNLIRVAQCTLQLPETALHFNGSLDPDTLLFTGDADFQSADLSALGRILGSELEGELSLQARLDTLKGKQTATLEGRGKSLSAFGTRIGDASLSGTLADPGLPGLMDIELEMRSAGLPDMQADTINARMRGVATGYGFDIELRHASPEADLSVRGELSSDLTGLAVEQLRGTLLQQELLLKSPFDMSITSFGASWREADLNFGPARLRSAGGISKEMTNINAELTDFDPALLWPLFPDLPSAVINARLDATGDPSNPDARLRIQAEKIRLESSGLGNLPRLSATADVRLRQNMLDARASLTSESAIELDANLSSPMRIDLFAPAFPPDAPLSGQLKGQTRLMLLPHVLRLDDQTLDGNCTLDFRMNGTWSNPGLDGTASVRDARYENFRSGTVVQNLNMNAKAAGSTLSLDLSATDGAEGTAEATGQVDLLTLEHMLNVLFNNFRLLRQDLVQSTAKGDLRLLGNLDGTELSGKMTLDPTTVRLPAKTPADLAQVEVVEINVKNPRPKTEGRTSDFLLGLDLRVAIPARLFVQGRGLESEWSGNLHIRGNHSKPVINGEMNLLRGKFDFLDRSFTLTKGSLSLNGETPPNPFLEVLGETQILENLIQVRISGPARDFRLNLSSIPALPQDELLALILFGRSLRQISPLQAVRLAQAAAEMTGLGGASPDFLDSIKSSLGLQEVDVTKDDEDNTALGVGGYFGGKYYIRTQSSVSGQDRTKVEVQLSPKISVETEVGSDSRQGGGVMWKLDY